MSVFFDLVARVVVLLTFASLAAMLLRRRSASVRASVWTGALAAALLLPVVSAIAPEWRIPIWAPAYDGETANAPAVVAQASTAIALSVVRASETAGSIDAPAPETFDTAGSAPRDWTSVALLLTASLSFVLLLRIVFSHWRISLITQASVHAGPEWTTIVDDVRRELGIDRQVPVRATDATNVPAIAGVFRPVLLLPIDTDDWPMDVRRAVALHELAHVSRRDSASQLVGQIACAVYWFVPLAWHGARRAAALREQACDDIVLRAGTLPSAYAGSLIALAQSTVGVMSSATLAMAEPSRIRERVAAILNPAARRERLSWRSAACVLVAIGAVTTAVGAIEPTDRAIEAGASVQPESLPTPGRTPSPPPRVVRAAMDVQAPAKPGPAAKPVAPAPQAQAADRLCGGKNLDHSSNSIHEDNDVRHWTVKLSGDGCSVDLRAEGKIEFNADFTDISRIGSDGFFRVDVTDRGVRRQLDVESRGGALTRKWRVDGSERPYDADARAWFAAFLIELDRRTAIGVDIRLPQLIRQGGVDAVLKETSLMSSDYARSQYYTRLARAAKLTAAEVTRLLQQASTLTSSDYYAAELVEAYAAHSQDTNVRAALVALLERMTSDYYRATSIEHILGPGAPTPAEMDLLVRLVPKMSSDHYKTQVLMNVLRADSIGASQRAAISTAVASIESDYYRAEVLTALLRSSGLTERDLMDAVASAKSISSDHYKSQTLERIARHNAATDRVRTAVIDASAGLSRHYADQVRRAAGK